jgi:hypothetical protein
MLPDPRFRSPTAVGGKADVRDDNVYSSVVLCHGGAGQAKIFANPIGQNIPQLAGAGIAGTAVHHITYSEISTNLSKAGELGSAIGDAAIRSIGITIEQSYMIPATGAYQTYGATPREAQEISSKVFFQFRVASKPMITGPAWAFPALGGITGGVSTDVNNSQASLVTNGGLNGGRRLKLPIMIARTDTLEGVVGVGGSAALSFAVQAGVGQETMLTVMFTANVQGDVR